MDLRKVLTPKLTVVNLPARTKMEVINALVDLLMQTGKVKNRDEALKDVLERERKLSTGIRNGIGIPHGKTDAVDELVACVAVTGEEVDFEALDKKPCRIFVMTLSSKATVGPHLQFLAEVSALLKSKRKRNALLAAKSNEEVYAIITGTMSSSDSSEEDSLEHGAI